MRKQHEDRPNRPQDFDINEVPKASEEAKKVLFAGTVETWKTRELEEKAKARPYISRIVIGVWAIGIIISALRLLITGDFLLVIPPTLISVPLYIILRFYFKSG